MAMVQANQSQEAMMPSYLKVTASPEGVSPGIWEMGFSAQFLDHSSGGYTCTVRYGCNQFELVLDSEHPDYPGAPELTYSRILIPTEPIKAAQGKVKISEKDQSSVKFDGWGAELTMNWQEMIRLPTPPGFSVSFGAPVELVPLPEKYPDLRLRITLFNEPADFWPPANIYIKARREDDWVHFDMSTAVLHEGSWHGFYLNGKYIGDIDKAIIHYLTGWLDSGINLHLGNGGAKPGDFFEVRLARQNGFDVVYSSCLDLSLSWDAGKSTLQISKVLFDGPERFSFWRNGERFGAIGKGGAESWCIGDSREGISTYYHSGGAAGDVLEVRRGEKDGPVVCRITLGIVAWLDGQVMHLKIAKALFAKTAGMSWSNFQRQVDRGFKPLRTTGT
ncbi:hypothetical protein GT347_02945 [Xylophilus rhododendri]|uniref:Uncharacterized protein n=1 Tax=Xylophilus rhododendri TaxID=2697032 RepID=A0A857J1S0_9BURK|nr:hypothetical protein [Xylophilus rhododendri]QHI97032.1 hypothetical protein GT347_02945 [Xylophilus rhododendri]